MYLKCREGRAADSVSRQHSKGERSQCRANQH